MPWKPSFEGEVPTLGFLMLDWYSTYLSSPSAMNYEPLKLYREQEDFILRWYALNEQGRRQYIRGVLQRPRGWGKSPILGAIAIGEALGPCVFDGWDADGQPVGKPWKTVRQPLVDVAASSDDQTGNTWTPLLEMLNPDAPIYEDYFVEPHGSYIDLGWGRIDRVTSSARSVKGRPSVFVVLDQTETWVQSNGGLKFADTLRSNAGKVGGTTLESPNAFYPGEGSVAEASAKFYADIQDGKAKDDSLLYDHREAPADTDIDNYDSCYEGLRVSYGDSSGDPRGCVIHNPPCEPGHVDIGRNVRTIMDPTFDRQLARSDYLNQIVKAADAWLSKADVDACIDLARTQSTMIEEGDVITLGFDGSRGRAKGNADATALIGCRVSDGALFEIKVWQPDPKDKHWTPPIMEIESVISHTFNTYRVVGFYADPSKWDVEVARWEAKYGKRLRVKASQKNPIAAWPRGRDSRVPDWLVRLRDSIENHTVPILTGPYLASHMLNARIRKTNLGYLIYKAFPESPDKIDAAYAATIAYRARTDALSAGMGNVRRPSGMSTGKVVIS